MKYLPRVKLYANQHEDQQIITWLHPRDPHTNKSRLIKETLIRGINSPQSQKAYAAVPLNFDYDTLRRDLLPDIRRIIDAALQQTLATLHVSTPANPSPESTEPEDQNEIEDILDDFEMSFMLDDDDEEEEL